MKKTINIENIISQRLSLQSTQRSLVDFGIDINNINYIKQNKEYISSLYKKWPEEKQKKFLTILGGGANFKFTKEYIEK